MYSDVKKCPYCGDEIKAVAKKCRHCGEWLDKTATVQPKKNPHGFLPNNTPRNNRKGLYLGAGAILVVVIFAVTYIISSESDSTSNASSGSASAYEDIAVEEEVVEEITIPEEDPYDAGAAPTDGVPDDYYDQYNSNQHIDDSNDW